MIKFGIIGGMGPNASLAFMNTIYRREIMQVEQELTDCLLYSIPSIQDRTKCIQENNLEPLVQKVKPILKDFNRLKVQHVIICCYTLHVILPLLQNVYKCRIRSLIDACMNAVAKRNNSYILLCTNGARISKIFEDSDNYKFVHNKLIFLSEPDQNMVHNMIYKIKCNFLAINELISIRKLLIKYNCCGVVLGCTDLHKYYFKLQKLMPDVSVLDPLTEIIDQLSVHREGS